MSYDPQNKLTHQASEETEVKHVDNDQIIGPVQEVEHEEDGGEEVHCHPVHPLVSHLYLLPDTPGVPLMITPLSVNLLRVFTLFTLITIRPGPHLLELAGVALQGLGLKHLGHGR